MNAFVTISTRSHLTRVFALAASLRIVSGKKNEYTFWLLLTEKPSEDELEACAQRNIQLVNLEHLLEDETGKRIWQKYKSQPDELRWSLKPVLMAYVLRRNSERVIYLDNDLFFFEKWDFLFEELVQFNVLLCPHWRISDPEVDPDWFETNFKDGLYNAGFVGSNRDGIAAMDWWAKACAYKCEKNTASGLFDDQKYLDFLPAHFTDVGILQHRGCNVAYWNRWENRREKSGDKVLINGKFPIVFIHFTADLTDSIENGEDFLLKTYLEKYSDELIGAEDY